MHGENRNIDWYEVYDSHHELMNGHEFTPADKASGGTRVVGFYSLEGQRRLCFKQWPEAPGHEIAVYELYKELFPEDEGDFPLPASDVILMNGQVFLVSEFMEGEPLDKILEKVRTDPEYGREWIFNTEKFQKLAIFSLLIQPEDGRPQNYLVRKIKDIDEYQLILIDNERILEVGLLEHEGFIEHEDPDKGYVKTRMHCALLCFHELLEEKIAKDFLKGHNEKFNIDEEAIEKLINEYLERHVSDPDINEICDRGLIDLEEDHEITEEEYEAEEDEKSDVEDDPDFNWTFTCFSRNSELTDC